MHALHPLFDACVILACTSFWQGTPPKFGKFDWRDPLDLGSQLTDEERHVQVGKTARVEPGRVYLSVAGCVRMVYTRNGAQVGRLSWFVACPWPRNPCIAPSLPPYPHFDLFLHSLVAIIMPVTLVRCYLRGTGVMRGCDGGGGGGGGCGGKCSVLLRSLRRRF